jgi:hypothetical protein
MNWMQNASKAQNVSLTYKQFKMMERRNFSVKDYDKANHFKALADQ